MSAATTPDPTDPMAEAAEQVRAYLVTLRGGAPFLSSADARLLLGWLDQGVPVPLILGSLDRVAERRRQRRSRGRMSLTSARRTVEKAWGTPQPGVGLRALGPAAAALDAWLDAVAEPGDPAVAGLVTAARDRVAEGGALEALIADLGAACRRFHAAQWQADPARQEALVLAARGDFASVKDKVSDAVFADLVAEAARGRLRARWPLVSAAELWDRVAESLAAADR